MGKQKDEIIYNVGCPDWMLTFGDCMSLLLCFFVMMMIFSTPDESKLMDVMGGLQGALGIVEPINAENSKLSMVKGEQDKGFEGDVSRGVKEQYKVDADNLAPVRLRELKVKKRYSTVKEAIRKWGFKNIVSTQQLEEGILVKVSFSDVFQPGSDELKPGIGKWLDSFAGLAGSVGNEIRLDACFSPESPSEDLSENMGEAEVMSLFKKRLDVISFALNKRYDISPNRLGIAFSFLEPGAESTLEMLLAEKLSASEVSMTELIKQEAW